MVVNYISVGPGTLSIGATGSLTDFSAQVTSVKLTPSVDNGDPLTVLSGEQIPGDRTESFTLDGTFVQDYGSATGTTTEYLFTHRGETQDFEFIPSNAQIAKTITGKLVVEAIDIGGDAGTTPTSDFSFVVVGAPVLGGGAAAAATASASKA
jgi:hypothetical protein